MCCGKQAVVITAEDVLNDSTAFFVFENPDIGTEHQKKCGHVVCKERIAVLIEGVNLPWSLASHDRLAGGDKLRLHPS